MKYYLVTKDLLNRQKFIKYEKIRRIYKHIQQNFKISPKIRMHYSTLLNNTFHPHVSISRLKNRCIISGRGRSVYRDFRLTRIQLRHLASFGYLMGIKKSS
jgi:small subunit ribosomal protein S14